MLITLKKYLIKNKTLSEGVDKRFDKDFSEVKNTLIVTIYKYIYTVFKNEKEKEQDQDQNQRMQEAADQLRDNLNNAQYDKDALEKLMKKKNKAGGTKLKNFQVGKGNALGRVSGIVKDSSSSVSKKLIQEKNRQKNSKAKGDQDVMSRELEKFKNKNLQYVQSLQDAFKEINETTRTGPRPEGEININRSSEAYMGMLFGEDVMAYLARTKHQNGLDVSVFRDISGSTGCILEELTDLTSTLMLALDLPNINTSLVDWSSYEADYYIRKRFDDDLNISTRFRPEGGTNPCTGINNAIKHDLRSQSDVHLAMILTDGEFGASDLRRLKESIDEARQDVWSKSMTIPCIIEIGSGRSDLPSEMRRAGMSPETFHVIRAPSVQECRDKIIQFIYSRLQRLG